MRKHKVAAFIAILTLLACAGLLTAQGTTGSISGTVTDSSGALVPGVTVAVTNIATNLTRTAATAPDGSYSITFLPVGTYRLDINAGGFKKFEQTGIILEITRNARVDPALQIGALSETVSVNADAPLINTNDAGIGRTVTNEQPGSGARLYG